MSSVIFKGFGPYTREEAEQYVINAAGLEICGDFYLVPEDALCEMSVFERFSDKVVLVKRGTPPRPFPLIRHRHVPWVYFAPANGRPNLETVRAYDIMANFKEGIESLDRDFVMCSAGEEYPRIHFTSTEGARGPYTVYIKPNTLYYIRRTPAQRIRIRGRNSQAFYYQ